MISNTTIENDKEEILMAPKKKYNFILLKETKPR